MLCTNAAGSLERFAKCPAGSVETHRRVIRRDAKAVGNLLKRLILKLHSQEHLAIFGFHGLGDLFDAVAYLLKQFFINHHFCLALSGEPFPELGAGCPLAVVVDQQIPEDSVKPRHDLFFVAHGICRTECLQVGCLE